MGEVIRARKPKRLPVVMTRDEVKAVLANLTGDKWLMASLMYGAGLRLMECLRMCVKDIDFSRNEVLVRDRQGSERPGQDATRITQGPLQDRLKKVIAIHERDLAQGRGCVQMRTALDRKYPSAPAEWRWQWVLAQEIRWINPQTKISHRRRKRPSSRGVLY